MLDHIGFPVSDFARSRAFYESVLAPLGYGIVMEVTAAETGGEAHCGFGRDGKPSLWIGTGHPLSGRLHVALQAENRAAVDAFHLAAMALLAPDNGGPGLRPQHYHPHYYAAFVLDPDGHNIEAVCHSPG